MQIMVDLLKREIAYIFQLRLGGNIPGSHQLFFKVDFELNLDLAFLYLFVKQSDLLLRIGQRVVGDGEQFRVLADSFYILGGDLFPVANALLDEIGRIF